jgi:hypothetical protein
MHPKAHPETLHPRHSEGKLAERKEAEWVFLITVSDENFGRMRRTPGRKFEYAWLYKSYLENAGINTQDALRA